jgi:CubicO group peptidase (beta-lactamase class C family)
MERAGQIVVQGACDPAFQAVRDEFERNFAERGELGASVCVTLAGRTVVDLWGGVADAATGRQWERDTICVAWSCTKGATALCAHLLLDRGELRLDEPVARRWPEFAQAGKEDVTVRMLLAHQAGLAALRQPLPPGAFYDWALMTAALAAETPFWQPGTRHGYHGLTFGYLVGELVRRVTGLSIGRFFRQEVAEPLGIDFWIGLPPSERPRVAPVVLQPPPDPANLNPMERMAFADPTSVTFLMLANTGGYMNPGECDTPAALAAEIPSAGGVTNGRGLAGMYAPLAGGGGRLASEGAVRRMAQVASASCVDACLLVPTRFALGFGKTVDNRTNPLVQDSVVLSEEAFGHPGMGGSIGFADPGARMSFGYVMNRHGAGLALNERGQRLVDAAYRSAGYTSSEPAGWA